MSVANVTIAGQVTGGLVGNRQIGPFTLTNPSSTDAVNVISSANGDNTITVPANAVGVVIVPPAGNTAAIKLKGSAGDVGVPLHVTNPFVYSFPAGTTSFILNIAAGSLAFELTWF